MPKRIVLIQGHPDPDEGHFCRALAQAYRDGAEAAGHQVRDIDVTRIDFPILRSQKEWVGAVPPGLQDAQDALRWANHLVVVFPLWLGTMPALLKGFFEQVLRPGFAVDVSDETTTGHELHGKSARIVVTMGMPAFVFRWVLFAHGLKSAERSMLGFCGVRPIRHTVIGSVESSGKEAHQRWLQRLRQMGRDGR